MAQTVALVVGAGEALGASIARAFAREGHTVCAARRDAAKLALLVAEIEAGGGKALPFALDATDEDAVVSTIARIEAEVGPIEVAVFNAGINIFAPITEMPTEVYRELWEVNCFGGFLVGREVARRMVPRGRGTIIFTGATASLRGGARFAAFAGAKNALRALAQSMARELGSRGIHVAHTIIDGVIDTAWIRETFPERYALKENAGILDPDHIAQNYVMLHKQPRDAWTHELDLRPWIERW